MIYKEFAFPRTVVVREFGNHCKLVEINPQVLMIVVFLYYCDFCCTSFTPLEISSTKAWDAGGFSHRINGQPSEIQVVRAWNVGGFTH